MVLCGCRGELTNAGAEGGEDGRGRDSSSFGEVIAVGTSDLVDQTVGAQQAEFATGPGGASAGLGRGGRGLSEAESLQIAIAHAVQGELAATDGLDQLAVIRREGLERARTPTMPVPGLAKSAQDLLQRGVLVDAGQGIEIALCGLAGQIGRAHV